MCLSMSSHKTPGVVRILMCRCYVEFWQENRAYAVANGEFNSLQRGHPLRYATDTEAVEPGDY
jgi:hypothetical protein